jgi:divalent metal cation (Fe/Co/Zn/Cd) transporter
MTGVADMPGIRQAQIRRGRLLEYATLAYTLLEAIVGVTAGWRAGSVALMSFGADSAIELASASALLWRLRNDSMAQRQRADRLSHRIVGVCFFALAALIAFESAKAIIHHEVPEHSVAGIILLVGAVLLMPLLARAKRRISSAIGSSALRADAKQNDFCAWLSAITLVGLVLNASFGWWWADPLAAVAMLPIILREAWEAVRGRACTCNEEEI